MKIICLPDYPIYLIILVWLLSHHLLLCLYWLGLLFNGVKVSLFSPCLSTTIHLEGTLDLEHREAVTFQQWKFYKGKYLFYIWIYQKQIPISEIITTQIGPDTENSEILHGKYYPVYNIIFLFTNTLFFHL